MPKRAILQQFPERRLDQAHQAAGCEESSSLPFGSCDVQIHPSMLAAMEVITQGCVIASVRSLPCMHVHYWHRCRQDGCTYVRSRAKIHNLKLVLTIIFSNFSCTQFAYRRLSNLSHYFHSDSSRWIFRTSAASIIDRFHCCTSFKESKPKLGNINHSRGSAGAICSSAPHLGFLY